VRAGGAACSGWLTIASVVACCSSGCKLRDAPPGRDLARGQLSRAAILTEHMSAEASDLEVGLKVADVLAAEGRHEEAIMEFEKAARRFDSARAITEKLESLKLPHLLALPYFERHPMEAPPTIFDRLHHRPIYADNIYGGVSVGFREPVYYVRISVPLGVAPPIGVTTLSAATLDTEALHMVVDPVLDEHGVRREGYRVESEARRGPTAIPEVLQRSLAPLREPHWWRPTPDQLLLVIPVELDVAGVRIQASHDYRELNSRDHRELALVVYDLRDGMLTLRHTPSPADGARTTSWAPFGRSTDDS
jgi:hypothetical protein